MNIDEIKLRNIEYNQSEIKRKIETVDNIVEDSNKSEIVNY
jgi:hypothetical protein